jgi:hypothetical protein
LRSGAAQPANSMTGPLALGLAGWASAEIDRETERGYEKSTVIGGNGNKALEKAAVGKLDLAKLASKLASLK